MASIDVTSYLEPVSDDAPCGEDLEYDAAFGELERTAQGKAEQRMGDEVIPAEPPNWREVFDQADELMKRSRDLRIVIHLTHAGLNIDGMSALADGLKLMNGLLENFWDSVYPLLDAEDDNDPTIRANSLASLNDRAGLVHSLNLIPLVDSRQAGRFCLRDIRIVSGEIKARTDEQPPEGGLIDAAFMDCDLDALTALAEATNAATEELAAMEAYLAGQIGGQNAPDLGLLRSELGAIKSVLAGHLAERGVASDAGDEQAGGAPQQAEAGVGQIQSREDAIRVLDRLSEYFRKSEPSSPVPLLLKRAKRLIAKDFMEILQDLAPDAVAQAKVVSGKDDDD